MEGRNNKGVAWHSSYARFEQPISSENRPLFLHNGIVMSSHIKVMSFTTLTLFQYIFTLVVSSDCSLT